MSANSSVLACKEAQKWAFPSGHDILDVSKILGHTNLGITLKIYAHS